MLHDGDPKLEISLKITAGALDDNLADSIDELEKAPEVPKKILDKAEEQLKTEIIQLFEKTRSLNCDIFECVETLKRKEYGEYHAQKDSLLERITPIVKVSFTTVR